MRGPLAVCLLGAVSGVAIPADTKAAAKVTPSPFGTGAKVMAPEQEVPLDMTGDRSHAPLGVFALPHGEDNNLQFAAAHGKDGLQLNCEEGCNGKQFCLRPACWEGKKCETEPLRCDDKDWATCDEKKTPCPAERQAQLCARASGEVCENRFGAAQETAAPAQEMTDYAKVDWSQIAKGVCFAVGGEQGAGVGATDEWCTKTCASSPCSPSVCMCGEKMGASIPVVKAPAANPMAATPNENHADPTSPTRVACVSLSTRVDDYWCETTCETQACPTSMCKCGADVAAEKALKKKQTKTSGVCDFENVGCIWTNSSYQNSSDCRSCTQHTTNCMSTKTYSTADVVAAELAAEECVMQVAEQAPKSDDGKDGCGKCATPQSVRAYKAQLGMVPPEGEDEMRSPEKAAKDEATATKDMAHVAEVTRRAEIAEATARAVAANEAAMQEAEAMTATQNQQVKAAAAAQADAEARAEAQASSVSAENAAEDAKRDAMTRTSGVPAAAAPVQQSATPEDDAIAKRMAADPHATAPASAGQLPAAWHSRLQFLQYGSLAMAG